MLTDLSLIFTSWFALLLWQIVSLPFLITFFSKKLVDAGWGFGRFLSWLAISLTIWFGAHLGLPINQSLIVNLLFLLLSINLSRYLYFHSDRLGRFFKQRWGVILIEELLFFFFFTFLILVRGHQPRVEGLEKFMDVGFMASYLRSPLLPASDMWLAGEKINYYTFGHFMGAIMTQYWNVDLEYSYNLLLGLIMGLVSIETASLVLNLAQISEHKNKKKSISVKELMKQAIIGGLLLVLIGNGHTSWSYFKHSTFTGYWYPDATRFIENTIHEFPAYSFIVSDLHAHVWAMPLVLTIMLGVFLWIDELIDQSSDLRSSAVLAKGLTAKIQRYRLPKLSDCFSYLKRFCCQILVCCPEKKRSQVIRIPKFLGWAFFTGSLLGVAICTSTWDFLVYSLLLGVLSVVAYLHKKVKLSYIIISALVIIGAALFTALPWLVNFVSISEGVGVVTKASPLWQLLVLWAPHLVISLTALTLIVWVISRRGSINSAQLLIVALVATSILLLLIPEFVYVKDIYPNHPRANTMFKLTFQAFIMMTVVASWLCASVSQAWVKRDTPVWGQLMIKVVVVVFIGWVGYYSYFGYRDFYGGLKNYQGLDGLAWMRTESADDYAIINWLRTNVRQQPAILEAVGESYTTFARISTFTGLPTPLGWRVHEWLWRGGFDIPAQRTEEVRVIFETPLSSQAQQLIAKYHIQYIILSEKERKTYPQLDEISLKKLGKTVFTSGSSLIIHLDQ